MKKILTLTILVTMMAMAPGSDVRAVDDAKITIKIATLAPKGSNIMDLYEEMASRIREKTDNEVAFKIYWGGVQGDEKDVIRKIRLGQLHGGGFMGPGLGLIVPQVRVTEIPYLFRNYEEIDYVRSRLEERMNVAFEEAGFKVLGWLNLGFVYNFSKVPITSLEIARQQKWWTLEGEPIGRAVYSALGISPISLSITDVATSLSTHLIDCANSTPYGAVAFQWYTRFNYMGNFPSTNVLGASIVTKKVWDRISPQAQQVIMEEARASHGEIVKATRAEDEECLKILKDAGITVVHEIENEHDIQFIFDAAKKARESLVGELYSQELLDLTLALLEEYRRLHPENTTVIGIH